MIYWFKINNIEYGWFGMKFGEHYVEASDFLGYDLPQIFLRKILNVLEKRTKDEWLYLMNEPGADMMHIYEGEDKVHFEVWDLSKCSDELDRDESAEKDSCTKCNFSMEISWKEAVDGLVTEFALYENGNGRAMYEKHWGPYPEKEYAELKKHAYEIEKTLTEYEDMFCISFL